MLRNVLSLMLVLSVATVAFAGDVASDASARALSTLLPTLQDAELDATALPGDPFTAGSWTFQSYGSASVGDSEGEMYLAHAGVGYFLADNISLNLEAVLGGIDADGSTRNDSTWVTGLDLLFRWHMVRGDSWSLYADGGAGIVWSGDAFPQGGTHQNFTPQLGIGGTWQLSEQLHLMGGVRWHHLSNARKSGKNENPGWDAAMFYAGVMIPF